ncbi:phosphatase PAP2 family protein [Hymenobacter antarcticus]|uniref:phosphatase PAP2 family protein n=1 Tax=Hymenobacter antarcticus TaxID=486270 RepID=UPI0031E5FAB2
MSLLILCIGLRAQAQIPVADSAVVARPVPQRPFRAVALRIAVPSVLVGVGVLAHSPRYNQTLYEVKREMQEETQEVFGDFNSHGIDDYTRHAPLAVAYGLMATGHRGERTALGFTLIYLAAHELDQAVVSNLKRITAEARPNNATDLTSFPSSHTSQAFLTATLLHEQYGRQYPWLSVSGYAVAAATGTMRVLSNKHWATDVLAGAGIGFLSAETVWHLYPTLTRLLPKGVAQKLLLVPTYVPGGGAGFALAYQP